jgi:hypothetical protein
MVYSQVAEADSEKPEPAADVVPIGKDDFCSTLYLNTAQTRFRLEKHFYLSTGFISTYTENLICD